MIPDGNSYDRAATRSLSTTVGEGAGGGFLLVVDGETSRCVALPQDGLLLVGRGAEADIRIDGQAVSRRHAELLLARGEARLSDLDSHNGTLLNGEPLDGARVLAAGDVITIGEVTLLYRPSRTRSPARPLLEGRALRERLDDELERVRGTARPLGLVALVLPASGAEPAPRGQLGARLAASLPGVQLAGWSGDRVLICSLPERDRRASTQAAERLLRALRREVGEAGVAGLPRLGVAMAPDDGLDAATLIEAARGAALQAAPGTLADASRTATELELGERRVLLADPAMIRLYELIARLGRSDLPVLVRGETGVGKEHAAWAVHWNSPRRQGPFIAVNCAALTESLAESELFGHEKGAFSGASSATRGWFGAADGGTLFLDEVGELSPAVQSKLLRVLESRRLSRVGGTRELPVDVRLVTATHRDLQADVEAGRFRRDLFFRIGGAVVHLPALRDRPREVALLARRFLDEACARLGREPLRITTGAQVHLLRWAWPGNVRELRNLMEYLAATVAEDTLEPWQLPEEMAPAPEESDEPDAAEAGATPAGAPQGTAGPRPPLRPLGEALREFERARLLEALEAAGGVRVRAAQLVALPLRTFKYKLRQHGITGGEGC